MEYKDMKLIAFYLPQFHEIPENNDAWGNGFTEWTNVKKARPLCIGHYQPQVPLHKNYYNLLDTDVLRWQARLAGRAGIHGFCFYHYWFNGKLVLEKPVENLRKSKDIDINYCFAWANEPWTKTWHGAGGSKEILIPQTYGGIEEWENHFQYYLPYFKDKRYIKVKGKPMLLIYGFMRIPNRSEMIAYWKQRAIEEGFAGIHLVCMKVNRTHIAKCRAIDATVDFEPNKSKNEKLLEQGFLNPLELSLENRFLFLKKVWNRFSIRSLSYDALNRTMLETSHKKGEYRCVFINYDDTPRRGIRGVITKNASPKRFGRYLRKALCLSRREQNEYLFINAWNEWGEGNHLEPDERYGYAYLKEIKKLFGRYRR